MKNKRVILYNITSYRSLHMPTPKIFLLECSHLVSENERLLHVFLIRLLMASLTTRNTGSPKTNRNTGSPLSPQSNFLFILISLDVFVSISKDASYNKSRRKIPEISIIIFSLRIPGIFLILIIPSP